MNAPKTALSIVTTWIFPLAILFNLPYDALEKKPSQGRFSSVAKTIADWLGSPQSAITATMFNLEQIRMCTRRGVGNENQNNAYYVLSCFNQFQLPSVNGRPGPDPEFINTLIYGL